jgi:DNA-binding NtrC family response regulator
MSKARILVADDETILGNTLKKILSELGYAVALCDRGEDFFRYLDDQKPDLVLLDIYMGDVNGIQLLNKMRIDGWDAPVIIMTAHSDVSLAVRAMKEGAADFVVKPFDLTHLGVLIEKNLDHARLQTQVKLLQEELEEERSRSGIIGKSPALRRALETAEKLAMGETRG